jgi:hypothetical protein
MTFAVPPEQVTMVQKYAHAMADSAMQWIDRATIDQGRDATLDEASLREAICSGIAAYLLREIAKRHTAWRLKPEERR